MTRLAVLRHGETAWTRRGASRAVRMCRCCLESPCHSEHLPRHAHRHQPAAALRRAATLLGAPDAAREPRIIEMDWGEWQGESLAALRARLGEEMRDNEARGLDFRPAGGESPRVVLARLKPWLQEVAQVGEPTLAITHRGVIRALLAEATGWDMRRKPPAKLDWTAAHLFSVDADGTPRVERLNVK